VRTPNGEQRTLDIKAMLRPTRKEINAINFWNEVREEERDDQIYKRKSVTIGDDVVVWKLHDWMMDEKGSDNMVHAAKSAHALVLDLRGNGGGSLLAVTRMISNLVDHDVKVADPQGRKKFDLSPVAKTKGNNAFTGKVVVLVDSNSASASEILARVLQLEKRGIIVGDKTAGAVMVAEHFPMRSGLDHTIFYGASVTMWDFVMSDGHSLEHNGVLPDEQLVPTANDLASGRDPVLARAVELAGGKLSAEDAGKLFPYEWPPE
jgi:C-terminal processing protease CtpA/Prc